MRVIAAGVILLCVLARPAPAEAYKWYLTEDGKALHWQKYDFPYYIDSGDLDFVTAPREDEIIQEAFGVWNELEAPLEFIFVDHVEQAEAAFYEDPEVDQNHIVFVQQGWSDLVPFQHENAIAITRLSYSKADGELVDADMLINNQLYFFADCDDAPEEWLDYQDLFYVVLHEAGHMTGLDHSGDELSVMFVQHSTCADDPLHHLTPDDIDGFLSFYGTQEFVDLANPPEPDPELDGFVEGVGDAIPGDWQGDIDVADGGPKSPDCGCRMGVRPALPWGALLVMFIALLGLARRRFA